MTDEEIDRLFSDAADYCEAQSARLLESWGVDDSTRWDADIAAGTIRFSTSAGRVLTGSVVLLGTVKDTIWKWGWANESLPEDVRASSRFMIELADRTGLGIFREKAWRCTDPQAEGIAELACYLVNADCTYRMVSRGIVLQCILIDVSEAGVA